MGQLLQNFFAKRAQEQMNMALLAQARPDISAMLASERMDPKIPEFVTPQDEQIPRALVTPAQNTAPSSFVTPQQDTTPEDFVTPAEEYEPRVMTAEPITPESMKSEALRGFHGTHREFDRFNRLQESKRKVGLKLDTLGVWFTGTPEVARRNYGPRVIEADLAIFKPRIFSGKNAWKKFREEVEDEGSVEDYREFLQSAGFDGIRLVDTVIDGEKQDVTVALHEDQIGIKNIQPTTPESQKSEGGLNEIINQHVAGSDVVLDALFEGDVDELQNQDIPIVDIDRVKKEMTEKSQAGLPEKVKVYVGTRGKKFESGKKRFQSGSLNKSGSFGTPNVIEVPRSAIVLRPSKFMDVLSDKPLEGFSTSDPKGFVQSEGDEVVFDTQLLKSEGGGIEDERQNNKQIISGITDQDIIDRLIVKGVRAFNVRGQDVDVAFQELFDERGGKQTKNFDISTGARSAGFLRGESRIDRVIEKLGKIKHGGIARRIQVKQKAGVSLDFTERNYAERNNLLKSESGGVEEEKKTNLSKQEWDFLTSMFPGAETKRELEEMLDGLEGDARRGKLGNKATNILSKLGDDFSMRKFVKRVEKKFGKRLK